MSSQGVSENPQLYANLYSLRPNQEPPCEILCVDPKSPVNRIALAEKLKAVCAGKKSVVVVLDSGASNKLGKLTALLFRPIVITRIQRELVSQGWCEIHQWVLFPSSTRTSVIYERNSSAAKYAQSKLLPPNPRLVSRWLRAVVSLTPLGHPDVELIAVSAKRL